MTRLALAFAALCAGLALFIAPADAASDTLSVPLTVTEPAGLPRRAEPVTSGVPIGAGLESEHWALFDQAREVPCQFTVLPGKSPSWLLLDFQIDLAPHETRTLTLRKVATTAAAEQVVSIREDADRMVVNTGRLEFQISKRGPGLFDAVSNPGGSRGGSEDSQSRLLEPGATRVQMVDSDSADTLTASRPPERMSWEYRGPLRATLCAEGTFRRDTLAVLHYTLRTTFYAGQRFVDVEFVLRNSFAARERYVKVRSARLVLGAGRVRARAWHSGDRAWAALGSGGVAFEIIPERFEVTTALDPSTGARRDSTVETAGNDGLPVADLSHHGATLRLDFTRNVTRADSLRGAALMKSPLNAVASPDWYSKCGAFGALQFGTLDDEVTANQRWGWHWPTPGNPWSELQRLPPLPDFFVSWAQLDADDDPEADDLWQNLLMFGRTGVRGFFDRAAGWARYFEWEYSYRTDGFDYAWSDFWEGPSRAVARRPVLRSRAWTRLDSLFVANEVKRGKGFADHLWAGGLVDWYYVSGDRDALAAAVDMAEIADRMFGWRTPGTPSSDLGGGRFLSRHLLNVTRVWEATQDERWRTLMEKLARLTLETPSWDARGFFYSTDTHYPGARVIVPFFVGITAQALYRYWLDTGNAAARDRLIQSARFLERNGMDASVDYTGDYILVDYTSPGRVTHMAQDAFRLNRYRHVSSFDALNTVSLVDALDIGYRLSGDRSLLDRAEHAWARASKRKYNEPYDRLIAGAREVGRFASSLAGWAPHSLLFPGGGDETYTEFFFYDAAHAPDSTRASRGAR